MITKIFKGRSDGYGTYAYIENNTLVIGSNCLPASRKAEYLYEGSVEAFINSAKMKSLMSVNPELANDIYDYYSNQKFNNAIYDYYSNKNNINKNENKQEEHMTKLCEIKVTEGADSFKELVYQLTANGYKIDAAPVYKEFPKNGLDYWMIAIFDKEEK
jgi:hypothetical protein